MSKSKDIWRCPYCKIDMDISEICNEKYNPEIIKVNKDIWHTSCYKDYCLKEEEKKINRKIKNYITKTKSAYDKNILLDYTIKDDRTILTDWLLETYNEKDFAISLYIALDKAHKGEYKENSNKMDFKIILDMWKKLFPKLEKSWIEDCKRGKTRKGTNRVLYDFAVIASKYSDYIDWLNHLPDEDVISNKIRSWNEMPKVSSIHYKKPNQEKTFDQLSNDINC